MSRFYKGDKVRFADGIRRPYLVRPITEAEELAWYDSPSSKGMGEDGETKLPPRGVTAGYDVVHPDAQFTVVRARVRNRIGWSSRPGYAIIRDADGVEWHARRDELVKVEG